MITSRLKLQAANSHKCHIQAVQVQVGCVRASLYTQKHNAISLAAAPSKTEDAWEMRQKSAPPSRYSKLWPVVVTSANGAGARMNANGWAAAPFQQEHASLQAPPFQPACPTSTSLGIFCLECLTPARGICQIQQLPQLHLHSMPQLHSIPRLLPRLEFQHGNRSLVAEAQPKKPRPQPM